MDLLLLKCEDAQGILHCLFLLWHLLLWRILLVGILWGCVDPLIVHWGCEVCWRVLLLWFVQGLRGVLEGKLQGLG